MKASKKEISGSRGAVAAGSNGDKWSQSLQSVFELSLQSQGPERTAQLLEKLADQLRTTPRPSSGLTTAYVNTIPPEQRRKIGIPFVSHAATFTSVATLFA